MLKEIKSVIDNEGLPKIITFLDDSLKEFNHNLFLEALRHTLKKLLPAHFFERGDLTSKLKKQLPLVMKKQSLGSPQVISFYTLSHYRFNSFKFFLEMISQWLIPGEKQNVVLIYALDFLMPEISEATFTLCEIIIRVDDESKIQLIEESFDLIESELLMGMESKYIATRILEVKGLANDEKTALIQEMISRLVQKMPNKFDHNVITEMHHILLITNEEFKKKRSWRHLARMISVEYLFRQEMMQHIQEMPKKRKVFLKVFRNNFQERETVSLIVALNFHTEKEVFEERQLERAIHHHMPHVKVIPGSFVMNKRSAEMLAITYIEIEKNGNERFSAEEIKNLKFDLPKDVKSHIEHLMHPIFQPRNEEEIMRNMLTLAQEIKYARDIPQVFITFDQQTRANLFFTVLVVRIGHPDLPSIQEIFKEEETFLKYIHDRVKAVGVIRNKHPKQATVFRVKFRKESFLRPDHSIDLSQARQVLVNELTRIMGQFRDFNGGMISKQNELFLQVKESLIEERVKFNSVLLENFFYSLQPVIMQTLLEPEAFCTLFKLLLEVLKKGLGPAHKHCHKVLTDTQFVYVILLVHDRSLADELDKSLSRFRNTPADLASADLSQSDLIATGYIFRGEGDPRKEVFKHTLENAILSL